jgi:adenylate kinase
MNLVLLGAPGSGKGTQAKTLCAALGLTHISTGALFREHVSRGTPLGVLVSDCVARGALVPDDITVAMLRERMRCDDVRAGVVFDGFPRTVKQAEALDALMRSLDRAITAAISIVVPDEDIVERLAGRTVCRECQAPFHLTAHPFTTCPIGKCHGEFLYRREDDEPDTVRARLEIFHRDTEPVVRYYCRSGRLSTVDGRGSVDEVGRAVIDAAQFWTARVRV